MRVLQIAVGAGVASVLLAIVGVLLRRLLRRLYFAYYDRARQEILLQIEAGYEPQRILEADWSLLWGLRARAFDDLMVALANRQTLLRRSAVEQFELARRLMRSSGRVQHHLEVIGKSSSVSKLMRSATVLGTLGLGEALHALGGLLSHSHLDVKAAALRALERIGLAEAEPYLWRAARELTGKGENRLLNDALVACCRSVPQRLVGWLVDPTASVRLAAAIALAEIGSAEVAPSLVPFTRDPDPEVRARLVDSLGARANLPDMSPDDAKRVVDCIVEQTRDPVWFVRVRALDALARVAGPQHIPRILERLRDSQWQVRQKAAYALRSARGGTGSLKQLAKYLSLLTDNYGRAALVTDLEYCGITWDAINRLEEDPGPRVNEAIEFLQTLAKLGFERAARYALEYHPVELVRSRLQRLLEPQLQTVERSPAP